MIIRLATALALAAQVGSAQQSAASTPASTAAPQASPKPHIYFRAPANGATVGRTFDVVFGLRNYGVAPAGVTFTNTGHFHILINAEPPAPGVLIATDSLHRHYGAGQIETSLTLAPGTYTLRLVLGDKDHKVISPDLVSAPIRITVRR